MAGKALLPVRILMVVLLLVFALFLTGAKHVNAEEDQGSSSSGKEVADQTTPDQTVPDETPSTNEDQPGEITVYPSAFAVYQDGAANRTLYIRGSEFTADLEFEFQPPLSIGKRVSVTFVEDAKGKPMFGFRLIRGKSWSRSSPILPYETLYVTKVTRKGKTVLEPKEKIPVAHIYPRPEIVADAQPEKIKFDQTEITIKGVNMSPKATKLVFEPPLEAREHYVYKIDEDGTRMTLTLHRKSRWRMTSGPLQVIAILGGAGRIELPKPVIIANVVVPDNVPADGSIEVESITAPDTPEVIYSTYRGTNELTIKGTGFRAERPPVIKFAGSAAVQDEDFDLTVVSKSELTLRLKKTSKRGWLAKPGALTIKELNGEVLPFPIDIADVLETPEVNRDRKQLAYESQTITIVITGRGFLDDETSLGLLPDLKVDVDYTLSVRDTRTLELDLVQGKKWPQGVLSVVWIQVGTGKKMYPNKDQAEKGVRVALIEPDFGGVIQIKASSQKVYQSLTKSISVDVIVLPPKFEMKKEEDLTVQVELASSEGTVIAKSRINAALSVSETHAATLTMTLVDPDKDKWVDKDGRLLLTAILLPETGGNPMTYPLGASSSSSAAPSTRGVQVARVLPDVKIEFVHPPPFVYASVTSAIPLKGSGFTFSMGSLFDIDAEDLDDAELETQSTTLKQPIVFDPPLVQDQDFMVIFDNDHELSLELLPDKKWRSSPGKLTLVSVDSGAGPVPLNAPLVQVLDDDPDTICLNDCPYEVPFDGICGDEKFNPQTGEQDCWGRDCGDCGARKKSAKPEGKTKPELCSDECGAPYANDGTCEDGRPGAWSAQCPLCSDCSDCGACRENRYSSMPMCTNGVEGSSGELVPGLPCVFPFTYQGVTYDGSTGCVQDGRVSGGWGWCPTTENYEQDGKWGSCQYCTDVLNDPSQLDEDMDYYGKEPTTKELSSANKQKGGFDVVRWLVNTLFFLVVFGAIGSILVVVYRRRLGHRYQLVSNKAA